MGLYNIDNAVSSDMTNIIADVTIPTQQIDEAQDQKETEWINTRFTIQWGYFNSIAELKTALIMKAIWNTGKGYTADPESKVILEHISGDGKQTFSDILFSMDLMKRIGGDSFAEIIRDKESGTLINLKLLNPQNIKIIYDRGGRIIRYEQFNKTSNGRQNITFEPREILHFSHNKMAGEMHGISDIDALEPIILADNENFVDMKQIQHRGARPMILWKLKTDDTVKIAEFVAKIDKARNLGEDMFIPDDEDIVSHEVVQIDVANSVMAWRNDMRNKFYRAIGVPQVIFGSSTGTESGSKVEYLAHEQVFSRDQRAIEMQLWNQMGIKIKLNPPTSLLDSLQTDENKDAQNALTMQPSDATAGTGR